MTQFGEWLKQIVVIVLLSSVADLLLPTKAMQKYVRVVLGLAIIAAMIQPITPFFRYNWADQLSTVISSELDGNANASASQTSSGSDASSYDKTFHQQEEAVADSTVADSILAELNPSLRSVIRSVNVINALTPNRMKVVVTMSSLDINQREQIVSQITSTLKIAKEQIVVENGG